MSKQKKSDKEKEPYTLRKFCMDILEIVVTALVLTLVTLIFFQPCVVSGSSMYPTYRDKDVTMVWRYGEIKRNDIIAFNSHNPAEELYIKRVIAVGGDHLVIENSNVYVNDELIEETYINEAEFFGSVDTIIEDGYLFVMGDNRNGSTDSRVIGQINLDDVLGKSVINFSKLMRDLFK